MLEYSFIGTLWNFFSLWHGYIVWIFQGVVDNDFLRLLMILFRLSFSHIIQFLQNFQYLVMQFVYVSINCGLIVANL